MIKYKNNKYLDIEDNSEWTSVSDAIEMFKTPFDKITSSIKQSNTKKSKWYGIAPEKIRECWDRESANGKIKGIEYHKQKCSSSRRLSILEKEGRYINIISPESKDEVMYAKDQKFDEGIYLENIIYLKSLRLCGRVDKFEIIDNILNIDEYKTYKELKKESFERWDGKVRMLHCCRNLEDCNYNHAALQLSLYAYIIQRNNPSLYIGDLTIQHVLFEVAYNDQYGYPVYKKDENDDYIVKEVIPYKAEYMKEEVKNILNYIKR